MLWNTPTDLCPDGNISGVNKAEAWRLLEAYREAWRIVEAVEASGDQIRKQLPMIVNEWDRSLPRLKLRMALVFGSTVDYFIGEPQFMASGDYLAGELTLKEVSKYIATHQTISDGFWKGKVII